MRLEPPARHADETRWAVFVDLADKVGHRWYLWVFHSCSVVHYVLDESRSAEVVEAELAGVNSGFISCDRYAAYKKFARLHTGVVLAFCWAHQRRDFLALANDYPAVSPWAMGWVDAIAELTTRMGCAFRPATAAPSAPSTTPSCSKPCNAWQTRAMGAWRGTPRTYSRHPRGT